PHHRPDHTRARHRGLCPARGPRARRGHRQRRTPLRRGGDGSMSILEGLRLAVNGLLSNRLRSALTMLGILIGVSAVILLVGVGNGATVAVPRPLQSLGGTLLTVYAVNARGAP